MIAATTDDVVALHEAADADERAARSLRGGNRISRERDHLVARAARFRRLADELARIVPAPTPAPRPSMSAAAFNPARPPETPPAHEAADAWPLCHCTLSGASRLCGAPAVAWYPAPNGAGRWYLCAAHVGTRMATATWLPPRPRVHHAPFAGRKVTAS